jgi:hypothetical protein
MGDKVKRRESQRGDKGRRQGQEKAGDRKIGDRGKKNF